MKDCCSVYFKPGKCLHDILTKQDFRHGSKASVPAFIKMFQSEPGHLCVNIFVFKCPVQNISDFAYPFRQADGRLPDVYKRQGSDITNR